jgi:hypothetical protein
MVVFLGRAKESSGWKRQPQTCTMMITSAKNVTPSSAAAGIMAALILPRDLHGWRR